MKFGNPLLVFLIVLLMVDAGCGSFEYRKRPDNSEVAVIRDIQNVFPEFATEVIGILDSFKIQVALPEASLGHGEIKTQIVRLYDQKDQLSAQLRDFVVARYQSYINAELDPDRTAREKGRDSWNEITAQMHTAALELRKLKQSLDETIQAHAKTKEQSYKANQKKVQSKNELSEAGSAINKLVLTTTEPRSNPAAHKVVLAKHRLDEAIKAEEPPKARAEVEMISDGVSQLPFELKEPADEKAREKVERARAIVKELQKAMDDYDNSVKEQKELQIRIDQAEQELSSQLALAVDKLKTLGANLARQ